MYWSISGSDVRGQSLKLIDCDFEVGPEIAEEDTTYAVYAEGDRAERNNRLLMTGGNIPAEFDYGVFLSQGGTVALRDTQIRAEKAMYLGSAAQWAIDAFIDNVRIEGSKTYAVIPTHGTSNRFTHRDVVLDESVNVIETTYGISDNQYVGSRTILGEEPPTGGTHGLLGDIYRLKIPAPGMTYEWVCTNGGCGANAVWKSLTSVGE